MGASKRRIIDTQSPFLKRKYNFFIELAHNSSFLCTFACKTSIAEYFKTQPVLKAWLFGSYSRGEERPDSDVDILVAYDESSDVLLFTIGGIYMGLKNLLGRDVDLVEEGTLRPWAVDAVNKEKKLIYERKA